MHKVLNVKSGEHDINLELRSNYTVICGDSATGKSFLYYKLQNADNTDNIVLIDYKTVKGNANYDIMVKAIKESKNKFIVIDQVDDIQDKNDEMMLAINTDKGNNSFILIGRNPAVTYNVSDLSSVIVSKDKITLEYEFEEPLM